MKPLPDLGESVRSVDDILGDACEISAERRQPWMDDGADIFVERRLNFIVLQVIHESGELDDLVLPFNLVSTCSFEIENQEVA